MRCRVCFETVETYTPTGTNLLRAEQHPVWPGARTDLGDCPGSYGPVDDTKSAERDRRRTQAWYGEVPQTADINDYLREKGERP